MRATCLYGAGDVRVIDVPDPAIKHPAGAPHLVALVRAGAHFERGVLVERPEMAAHD